MGNTAEGAKRAAETAKERYGAPGTRTTAARAASSVKELNTRDAGAQHGEKEVSRWLEQF
ncbi:hypothetical protein AHiyo6_00390 [Arthrobacter sp. Hiyo6]|nr:hypothetical protein AHiyo6_00390 [Arthrobacter sp. Hiyo6]